MKHLSSLAVAADVLSVVVLLPLSLYFIFITLLVDFPFAFIPVVGVLFHAVAVGTLIYILCGYGSTGRICSSVMLGLLWLLGLFAVVFGFAPGVFFIPEIFFLKSIIFLYPFLFFYILFRTQGSFSFFRGTAVVFAGSFLLLLLSLLVMWITNPSSIAPLLLLVFLVLLLAWVVYRVVRPRR